VLKKEHPGVLIGLEKEISPSPLFILPFDATQPHAAGILL
jgi:hypothetical protein